jgi:hypothetical protein
MPDKGNNRTFEPKNNSQRRHDVILLGGTAFNKLLGPIQDEIRLKRDIAEEQEDEIESFGAQDDLEVSNNRGKAQALLYAARKAIDELKVFYKEVSTRGS